MQHPQSDTPNEIVQDKIGWRVWEVVLSLPPFSPDLRSSPGSLFRNKPWELCTFVKGS